MVKYRFVDDKPEEKKVARFRYVGSDEFGREPKITFYGEQFKLGEVTDVDNDYALAKLRSVWKGAFEDVEGADDDSPKKRGRPRKTDEEREAEKAEREAEKAKKEAEKEGAQPKITETDADDEAWEKGRTF